jgi:hypothetical protein
MGGNLEPTPISADYVELLKKQRELALPGARIAAYDDFAKWLFSTITVVGTLGAAFSNVAFKNLRGCGTYLFFGAICATGISLALAVVLRTIEPKDANWYSLDDMTKKAEVALKYKRRLAWGAGACFAAAIVLAGLSPLVSGNPPKDKPVLVKGLAYSYGKDAIHITGLLSKPEGTLGEIRVLAITPKDQTLLASQRASADKEGVIHFDVSSTAIPQTATTIKIKMICDVKDFGKTQEFQLVLHPTDDKLVPITTPGGCFE